MDEDLNLSKESEDCDIEIVFETTDQNKESQKRKRSKFTPPKSLEKSSNAVTAGAIVKLHVNDGSTTKSKYNKQIEVDKRDSSKNNVIDLSLDDDSDSKDFTSHSKRFKSLLDLDSTGQSSKCKNIQSTSSDIVKQETVLLEVPNLKCSANNVLKNCVEKHMSISSINKWKKKSILDSTNSKNSSSTAVCVENSNTPVSKKNLVNTNSIESSNNTIVNDEQLIGSKEMISTIKSSNLKNSSSTTANTENSNSLISKKKLVITNNIEASINTAINNKQSACSKEIIFKTNSTNLANNYSVIPELQNLNLDVSNEQSTNSKVVLNSEDLQKYIGDIQDLNFSDINMNNSNSNNSNESSHPNTNNTTSFQSATFIPWSLQSKSQDKTSSLDYADNVKNKKLFRFFWLDAYEETLKYPGIVFLFGKVYVESLKNYASCCVVVKNIPRKVYFLPGKDSLQNDGKSDRNTITFPLVYDEINTLMQKRNISEFRCKEVKKSYVFNKTVSSRYSSYIEVEYAAKHQAIDLDYSGPTIKGVYNTTLTALELFLLDNNIKGPCWLDVAETESNTSKKNFSWCTTEVHCAKSDVSISSFKDKLPPMPPIVLATLNVQVSLNSNSNENSIAAVGLLIHNKFHLDKQVSKPFYTASYCLVTHPKSKKWTEEERAELSKIKDTTVMIFNFEFDLLEKLLNLLGKFNPDVVISYDTEFQLGLLISKIIILKIKNWSKIGKLHCLTAPKFKGKIYLSQFFFGRPLCDIQLLAKEFHIKSKSYDLASLCELILKKKVTEIKPENFPAFYNSITNVKTLVNLMIQQATFVLEIALALNFLPLTVQLTNIAGNTLSRTMFAGVTDRSEYLLLHAFNEKSYIVPDKIREKSDDYHSNKKAMSYIGGTVLTPKVGFYNNLVLLMDFKSLYPTIIQEYNICFTTISGSAYGDHENISVNDCDKTIGILPTEIRKLVESRAMLKKSMESTRLAADIKQHYTVRQEALKLTANSLYGVLGSSYSRFYAKGLAAFITSKGRDIFQKTIEIIETLGHNVIYGDTDSVMIDSKTQDYERVIDIAKEIRRKINKTYKYIEIEVDQIFRCLLLLKKKQYTAMELVKRPNGSLESVMEIKGLDIVKRDHSEFARDVGMRILHLLFSEEPTEIVSQKVYDLLIEVKKSLEADQIPLPLLQIWKQLSRDPSKYQNAQNLSHVTVAQRLNRTSARKWKAGDIVPYVICDDGTKKSLAQKAYHIDELKSISNVKIDVTYYLSHEIYPLVCKICEPIQGIDKVLIAKYLGSEEYKKSASGLPLSTKNDSYQNCIPLKFQCPKCNFEIELKSALHEFPTGVQPSLAKCHNPVCDYLPWNYDCIIKNKIVCDIGNFSIKYYANELQCDNVLCSQCTKIVDLDFSKDKLLKCSSCYDGKLNRLYTKDDLQKQLRSYLNIFTLDLGKCKELELILPKELLDMYESIRDIINDKITDCASTTVDLFKLFDKCAKVRCIYSMKDSLHSII